MYPSVFFDRAAPPENFYFFVFFLSQKPPFQTLYKCNGFLPRCAEWKGASVMTRAYLATAAAVLALALAVFSVVSILPF